MAWWQYLILANLYLALFYGFYAFLLRRETFFQLNRVYLVASALISFIIPVIQADWVQNLFITQQVKMVIYNSPVILYQITPAEESMSVGEILGYVYIAGILLLAGKLVFQFISLKKLSNKNEPGTAYSFFKKVKVSPELDQTDIIAAHEEVHARQWHSADVLLMEVISILCWFNPVVYLYCKAIKHIHEFIADSQVVNSGADKAGYAMLLLTHTFNAPPHNLVNPFFRHSLLKQRIVMLQKNRSARVKLLKYGLSAPLFAAMIVLSSATANNVQAVQNISRKTTAALETPITEVRIIPPAPPAPTGSEMVEKAKDTTITLRLKPSAAVKDTVPDAINQVFTAVEEQPQFPGGMNEFPKYLGKNIRYPAAARNKKIAGRVFLSFIVEKDGTLTDVKVMRGIGGGCDEEAVRVVKQSPKWIPGKQNGKPVRVQYAVPIQFDIVKDETKEEAANKPAMLNEVTVVGYETSEKTEEKPAATLKGTVSGVYVTSGDATFTTDKKSLGDVVVVGYGKRDTVRARANMLIQGDSKNKPLIILDGKETSYDYLTKMNVNNIESITVLKDASATGVYGAKGMNGVLVITTKRK